jgi:hypothetical protein
MEVRRLAPIALALAASLTLFAGVAEGALSQHPLQETQLDRACTAAAAAVEKVIAHASTAQPGTIETTLVVSAPGKLTGRIAFNPAGKTIRVAADRVASTVSGFGCAQGRTARNGLGPGRSRQVSTLTATFTKPGTYTLTFTLNRVGRMLLAQLATAQKAYAKHHPHGHEKPFLAFGVSLTYESRG